MAMGFIQVQMERRRLGIGKITNWLPSPAGGVARCRIWQAGMNANRRFLDVVFHSLGLVAEVACPCARLDSYKFCSGFAILDQLSEIPSNATLCVQFATIW